MSVKQWSTKAPCTAVNQQAFNLFFVHETGWLSSCMAQSVHVTPAIWNTWHCHTEAPPHWLGQSHDVQWNVAIKHGTIKLSKGSINTYNYRLLRILYALENEKVSPVFPQIGLPALYGLSLPRGKVRIFPVLKKSDWGPKYKSVLINMNYM